MLLLVMINILGVVFGLICVMGGSVIVLFLVVMFECIVMLLLFVVMEECIVILLVLVLWLNIDVIRVEFLFVVIVVVMIICFGEDKEFLLLFGVVVVVDVLCIVEVFCVFSCVVVRGVFDVVFMFIVGGGLISL